MFDIPNEIGKTSVADSRDKMNIQVNSIVYDASVVDGPGVRTVLFLQGCDLRCRGCHNPSTWDEAGGVEYDTEEVAGMLKLGSTNRKVTISGGEPLQQADAVIDLLERLDGFDVCLYTGRSLSEVPPRIMSRLRCIKYGPYIEGLRCTDRPFVGSSNQSFVVLRGDGCDVQ